MTLPANTPGVFVKQDEAAAAISLGGKGVAVVARNAAGTDQTFTSDEASDWQLNGTFTKLNLDARTAAEEIYYISGDKFWHATGNLEVQPFRAYFTTPKGAQSAKAFRLVIASDDATEVQLMSEEAIARREVYTLGGVRINDTKNLKPGMYIINNKKTIVR